MSRSTHYVAPGDSLYRCYCGRVSRDPDVFRDRTKYVGRDASGTRRGIYKTYTAVGVSDPRTVFENVENPAAAVRWPRRVRAGARCFFGFRALTLRNGRTAARPNLYCPTTRKTRAVLRKPRVTRWWSLGMRRQRGTRWTGQRNVLRPPT